MRRSLFLTLGLLEFVAAVVLCVLSFQLPTSQQVQTSSQEILQITTQTSEQVKSLKTEIATVRNPEVRRLTEKMRKEVPYITERIRTQEMGYESLQQTSDALGEVATGLESFSQTLDPTGMQQMAMGLGKMADYLDKKVSPKAEDAAKRLEKSTDALAKDSKALSELLRNSTPDVKTAIQLRDSLKAYSDGLGNLNAMLDVDRLRTMQKGFAGMEGTLTSGAAQVKMLVGYTYPVVKLNGFRAPSVSQKAFWPKGKEIASGMTKGAEGLGAASKQMDKMVKDLPGVMESLQASQKAIEATHERLKTSLEQREKLEEVLKSVPETSATLAKELPQIGKDLAAMLRETADLKEVATSLRESSRGINSTVSSWPALQKSMQASAKLLRSTQSKLKVALENESSHKQALLESMKTADSLARVMPMVSEQLDEQLQNQSKSLDALQGSMTRVNQNVPSLSATAINVLTTVRWLLWVFACIIAVHGAHLLLAQARSPRSSES